MNVLVDTSVWSLAFRRDRASSAPEVAFLRRALEGDAMVFTTGLILQDLLQGVRGPKAREAISDGFSHLPFLVPDRHDHVAAADLYGVCRRKGLQIRTIDSLLAQLCIRHQLTMLTTDGDFSGIARIAGLSVWANPG